MKKLLSFTLLSLTLLGFSFSTTVQAQDRPFQIGAGLLYGSEVEELGLQVNMNYPILQNVELAPDLSIYFADDESGIDNFWELNINGHYFLSSENDFNVYGLSGLNITTIGYTFTEDSDTEAGINVGLGGEYYMEAFSLYGEIKYVLSDLDQLVLGAGVRLPF